MESEFDTFLRKKNIDPLKFRQGDPDLYYSWESLFGQISEPSFIMQEKFLINKIRRKYLLQEEG